MMVVNNQQDALHRAWLYRLLIAIADNNKLHSLKFKGGTCAAMLGYLNRFSVDLDFDLAGDILEIKKVRRELKLIFSDLGLEIDDESKTVPQFFLKYPSEADKRNTIKIDVSFPPPETNIYESNFFSDIGRNLVCQDIGTMFANKLVAILDRYQKNNSIAGRDIYDVYHFFSAGHLYNKNVIKERTGRDVVSFLKDLKTFIENKVTEKIITQDLNMLLPYDIFRKIRKTLKTEVIFLINNEINNLEKEQK
jgi:predicted nucleotidyltransferase component of viral defense system